MLVGEQTSFIEWFLGVSKNIDEFGGTHNKKADALQTNMNIDLS